MNKIKIILSLILAIGIICFNRTNIVLAANGQVSINASSVTVFEGDTVTITASVSGGPFYTYLGNISSSNSAVLSGSGTLYNRNLDGFQYAETTATFSAVSAGQATIMVNTDSSNTINVVGEEVACNSPSITITVLKRPESGNNSPSGNENNSSGGNSNGGGTTSGSTTSGGNTSPTTPTDTPEEEPKSTNNNLSGLSVSTGSLSPEFNADTTEYTVTLPADATTISIDASAADEKATVEGTGEHSLKAGLNEFFINVTAENGDAKNYCVRVNVDETPLVYTTFNNQKLGVVRNTDEIGIPNSFEETTVTLDGQEVKAWNSAQMNKTIVFLVNEAGEKNFYLFENNQITSIFKPVGLLGRNLYIVDVPADKQKMKGLIYGEVVIKDEKFNGWTFEDEAFSNYSIIYVMDELGNIKYYQYEKTEDALQLYSMAAPTTQEAVDKTNEKVNTQQMIIYALIATTLVGGGLAAYAFYQLVQSKKNSGYNKKFDYTNDDE